MMFARRRTLACVAIAAVAVAGCGSASGGSSEPTLTVSAAASLKDAFTACAVRFKQAKLRFSFAGSDELAAQIRKGVRPDVFAAANTTLPAQLFKEGKVEDPVVFAGNRLVIAVARGSSIRSVADLAAPGRKLVVGAPTVPIGSYTREAVEELGLKPGDPATAVVKSTTVIVESNS